MYINLNNITILLKRRVKIKLQFLIIKKISKWINYDALKLILLIKTSDEVTLFFE